MIKYQVMKKSSW